jgi:hypothetical protein
MAKPKIRPDVGSPEWRLLNALESHEKSMLEARQKLDEGDPQEAGQHLWTAFDVLSRTISKSSNSYPYPDMSKAERVDIVVRLAWMLCGCGHAHRAVELAMKHYEDVSESSTQGARLREVIRAAWAQSGYTAKSDREAINGITGTKKLAKAIIEAKHKKREEE